MSSLIPLELIDDPTPPVRELAIRKLHRMGDALAAGAVFPPIWVTPNDERYTVGDGFHRVSVYRRAGREVIDADVREFADQGELWLAMLAANAGHGDPLSSYEEQEALAYAESIGLNREQVAVALQRTVASLERRRIRATVRIGNKQTPLIIKSGLRALAGSTLTAEQERLHKAYSGGRPVELLRSLAIACELDALGPVTKAGRTYALRVIEGLTEWMASEEEVA